MNKKLLSPAPLSNILRNLIVLYLFPSLKFLNNIPPSDIASSVNTYSLVL